MNASIDTRPQPVEYIKNFDINGRPCIAHLLATRSGHYRVKLQLPDGTTMPVGNTAFNTEDQAFASAVRTAQRTLDAHPERGAP